MTLIMPQWRLLKHVVRLQIGASRRRSSMTRSDSGIAGVHGFKALFVCLSIAAGCFRLGWGRAPTATPPSRASSATPPASPSSPELLESVQKFNIVRFKGRFYCVPQGLAVDWNKDDVEKLPGVAVRATRDEAITFVKASPPVFSATPVLQQSVKAYNIVLFKGRYYCVPHGLAVDWSKDDVEKLPGVGVRDTVDQALAYANN